MDKVSNSATKLQATFRIRVNGESVAIETVGQALDRMHGQAQQARRLAAANLRAQRAGIKPMPAGDTAGFQQAVPGGQRTGAAAADDGDR